MEYPHVVVQFMFRIVPSVALTTGGFGHLLSPYCEAVAASRFFYGFSNWPGFLLDLPGYFFANPCAFQVGIVRQLARLP
jgi:hypothetical protein